jgi:hypothetical protein
VKGFLPPFVLSLSKDRPGFDRLSPNGEINKLSPNGGRNKFSPNGGRNKFSPSGVRALTPG